MSIEAAYQACMILKAPELATTWTKAARSPEALAEFNRAFNEDKKKKFEDLGLAELHKWWRLYSDWGHIGVSALGGGRVNMDVSTQKVQFEVRYFETDEKVVSLALMDLLYVSHLLEKAFFGCFSERLGLDPTVDSKREAFVQSAESARQNLINRYPELFRELRKGQD
jgi:hypothetical protein